MCQAAQASATELSADHAAATESLTDRLALDSPSEDTPSGNRSQVVRRLS